MFDLLKSLGRVNLIDDANLVENDGMTDVVISNNLMQKLTQLGLVDDNKQFAKVTVQITSPYNLATWVWDELTPTSGSDKVVIVRGKKAQDAVDVAFSADINLARKVDTGLPIGTNNFFVMTDIDGSYTNVSSYKISSLTQMSQLMTVMFDRIIHVYEPASSESVVESTMINQKIPDQDLEELIIPKDKLKQSIDDLYYDRDVNLDKQIGVWVLDDGTYLVVDGFQHLADDLIHHRLTDRIIIRGEGYQSYVKVPTDNKRVTLDHKKEFCGLESVYSRTRLKKIRNGETAEDPYDDLDDADE